MLKVLIPWILPQIYLELLINLSVWTIWYFYSIVTSPKRLMPSFVVIWVNTTSMAICKYYVTSSFSFFLVFTRNCFCCTGGYSFPSNIISSLSIPAPTAAIFGLLFSTWGASLFVFIVFIEMDASYYFTHSLVSSVYASWYS